MRADNDQSPQNPPGAEVLRGLLQETVQAATVPSVRECGPAAEGRPTGGVRVVQERRPLCPLWEDQLCPGEVHALRPGVRQLRSLFQGA